MYVCMYVRTSGVARVLRVRVRTYVCAYAHIWVHVSLRVSAALWHAVCIKKQGVTRRGLSLTRHRINLA